MAPTALNATTHSLSLLVYVLCARSKGAFHVTAPIIVLTAFNPCGKMLEVALFVPHLAWNVQPRPLHAKPVSLGIIYQEFQHVHHALG